MIANPSLLRLPRISAGLGPAHRLAQVLPMLQNTETRRQLFNQSWQASATALEEQVKAESKIVQDIITSRGIKLE